jgi:hypothetical protein
MFNRKGRKGLRKVREVFLRGDRRLLRQFAIARVANFLKRLCLRMATKARINLKRGGDGTRMEADEADGRGFFYGHEGTNYFEKMVGRMAADSQIF